MPRRSCRPGPCRRRSRGRRARLLRRGRAPAPSCGHRGTTDRGNALPFPQLLAPLCVVERLTQEQRHKHLGLDGAEGRNQAPPYDGTPHGPRAGWRLEAIRPTMVPRTAPGRDGGWRPSALRWYPARPPGGMAAGGHPPYDGTPHGPRAGSCLAVRISRPLRASARASGPGAGARRSREPTPTR